ncbi:hypothetical protein [Halorubrum sp. BV1]|uniref:DUF7542 family protein n=1 Tax=Halorubrum sp. BV1 TaxID=1498500 RepID=UPI00067929BF|nr:hypothetical protein [Halorubrum sp. BV1]
MDRTRVTVMCADCSFESEHERLRDARVALDDHAATGHDVQWEIESLAAGVTQAGADAGVCGRPECTTADSPLLDPPGADSSEGDDGR